MDQRDAALHGQIDRYSIYIYNDYQLKFLTISYDMCFVCQLISAVFPCCFLSYIYTRLINIDSIFSEVLILASHMRQSIVLFLN